MKKKMDIPWLMFGCALTFLHVVLLLFAHKLVVRGHGEVSGIFQPGQARPYLLEFVEAIFLASPLWILLILCSAVPVLLTLFLRSSFASALSSFILIVIITSIVFCVPLSYWVTDSALLETLVEGAVKKGIIKHE